MREKLIERKLTLMVKKRGGICPKFVSPGYDGMPDRIVLLPGCHFAFVEVKAPGAKPRPLQLSRHKLLRRLGFPVYVLDAEEQIGGILDVINKGTDDSDSCNIMYLIQRVKTEWEVSPAQLFTNAFRGFHPCLYHFDRITLMI